MKTKSKSDNPFQENRYKQTEAEIKIYDWLKQQGLNTDDNTLIYWSKTYPAKRIMEVVHFAQARIKAGQSIRNIGGWIHKFLITELAVANDECEKNRNIAKQFAHTNNWEDVRIYEKYIKDEITGDDLPLTMPHEDFNRILEILYHKSLLYKDL
jgi:hypothetical protein